eukprot:366225-Chlamydomonas_euryale.AAC.6
MVRPPSAPQARAALSFLRPPRPRVGNVWAQAEAAPLALLLSRRQAAQPAPQRTAFQRSAMSLPRPCSRPESRPIFLGEPC